MPKKRSPLAVDHQLENVEGNKKSLKNIDNDAFVPMKKTNVRVAEFKKKNEEKIKTKVYSNNERQEIKEDLAGLLDDMYSGYVADEEKPSDKKGNAKKTEKPKKKVVKDKPKKEVPTKISKNRRKKIAEEELDLQDQMMDELEEDIAPTRSEKRLREKQAKVNKEQNDEKDLEEEVEEKLNLDEEKEEKEIKEKEREKKVGSVKQMDGGKFLTPKQLMEKQRKEEFLQHVKNQQAVQSTGAVKKPATKETKKSSGLTSSEESESDSDDDFPQKKGTWEDEDSD